MSTNTEIDRQVDYGRKEKRLFCRLKEGLTKTRNSIVSGIDSVFRGFTDIDDDFYEEIEEILSWAT